MSSIREKALEARRRLKEQRVKTGSREELWLKKDVPVQVRILPDSDKDSLFIQECTIWSIPGFKGTFLDPTSVGLDYSPMYEVYNALKEENDPADKKLLEWFKPKTRWFLRVLVRELDDKKNIIDPASPEARYFYAPMDIADEILKLFDDDDYGEDIIDIHEGLDFTFEKTGEKLDTTYSASVRRKTSPLLSDAKAAEKFIDSLEPLQDKLKSLLKDEAELKHMVENMSITKTVDSKNSKSSMKKRNLSNESEDNDDDIEDDIEDEKTESKKPSSTDLRNRMRRRK